MCPVVLALSPLGLARRRTDPPTSSGMTDRPRPYPNAHAHAHPIRPPSSKDEKGSGKRAETNPRQRPDETPLPREKKRQSDGRGGLPMFIFLAHPPLPFLRPRRTPPEALAPPGPGSRAQRGKGRASSFASTNVPSPAKRAREERERRGSTAPSSARGACGDLRCFLFLFAVVRSMGSGREGSCRRRRKKKSDKAQHEREGVSVSV
jgi:hypothetical protein